MVYNPAAIYENKKYHLFYRAIGGAWVSKIGYAVSDDGENFIKDKHPALEPELEIEKNGIEDPRIVKIGNTFYMSYTAYDGNTARLCLAFSRDMKKWTRQGEVFPSWDARKAQSFIVSWDKAQNNKTAKKHWNKAGGIFSEKINNKYWMIFGDRNLWLASSLNKKIWQPYYKPFLKPRPDFFDSVHIEMGPPPIKTRKGWLVLYHGIDKKRVYRLGCLLLDLKNVNNILYRSKKAIFEPEKPYEISGLVDILPGGFEKMEQMDEAELQKYITKAKNSHVMPSVIFCTGAILKNNTLRIYYGAGDDVICTATANINDILNSK